MRKLATTIALILGSFTGVANAQTSPVVVELFTSQGCSSCPPADTFLGELSENDNILPLAFHVTYWDRLGWKDTFGHKAFTDRQYAYSTSFNNRSVWTPQFVVQGQDFSRNRARKMVADYVAKHSAADPKVELTSSASDGKVAIELDALVDDLPRMDVHIVHFSPTEQVTIKRGENAGRTLDYHNVVNAFYKAGEWNGNGSKKLSAELRAEPPYAVLVQGRKNGPIFASKLVRN
jgi:hypothetical protein